jgi:DNA-binding SARP family transcriptional activator
MTALLKFVPAEFPERFFRIFGAFELSYVPKSPPKNGSTLATPKLRQFVSLLAIEAGRPVSRDAIYDELWPSTSPSEQTFFTYVSQLRCNLWEGCLVRHGSGRTVTYRLDIDPDQVDILRFLRAIDQLSSEGNAEKLYRSQQTLNDAFALVRGEPFADVVCGPKLEAWINQIHATLRHAKLLKFEIALRLGQHRRIIGELSNTCDEHPDHEDFTKLLLLALYRAERRTEATSVYLRLRKYLAQELGIDPAPQLQSVYQKILRGDRSLFENLHQLG